MFHKLKQKTNSKYFKVNFLFPKIAVFYFTLFLLINVIFIRLRSSLGHFYLILLYLGFGLRFLSPFLEKIYFNCRRQYYNILLRFIRSEFIFYKAVTLTSSYLICSFNPFFYTNQRS